MAAASDFVSTVTLLDGAAVTLRRLNSDDYDAVFSLAITLSDEERYQRFFTVHPTYIGEWALSLTAPAVGVVALGVIEDGELIGVANYADLPPQPGYAEIAVVVAHEQHERGVGTALLRALACMARGAGLHRFVADVLFENYEMRRVIGDAGWPITQHRDGSVLSIEVDLDHVDDVASS